MAAEDTGREVFISYSTKNKEVADRIVSHLEENGITCWYAPRNIMPGQEWVSAIKTAIHACKVVVLLYTPESNASRQVMNEVAMAFNAGKTMVPFCLTDEAMNDELEYYLTRVHWLHAVSRPLDEGIEDLRQYIEAIRSGAGAVTAAQAGINAPSADSRSAASDTVSRTAVTEKKKKTNPKGLIAAVLAAVLMLALGCGVIAAIGGSKKGEALAAGIDTFYNGNCGTEEEQKAEELFLTAAKAGKADAYFYLGQIKERNYDFKAAKELYEKGIEGGSDYARIGLGYLYQNGYGVKVDEEKAWALFNEALENGCVEAEVYRAGIIASGMAGQELSYPKAIECLEKVTENSADPLFLSKAYASLGIYYISGGFGLESDPDKAIEYYEKVRQIKDVPYYAAICEYGIGLAYREMDEKVKAGDHFLEAYDIYESMAEKGNVQAMFLCGELYSFGLGVEMDDKEAAGWYEKAVAAVKEKNEKACHYDAMRKLGTLYEKGRLGGIDYEKAYSCYKTAADAGSGEAAFCIGILYHMGYIGLKEDGDPDFEMARQWYDKALDYGYYTAYNNIASIYMNGLGKDGVVDEKLAEEYYLKGAERGNAYAMYNLGYFYEKKNNMSLAIEWYEKAAALLDVYALSRLGYFYEDGTYVQADEEKAFECWMTAARLGDADSMERIGECYYYGELGQSYDLETALRWFKKSAEAGRPVSMYYVGYMYKYGEADVTDYEVAYEWLSKAADAGDYDSIFELGDLIFYDGDEIGKTVDEAVYWLEIAADAGYSIAAAELGDYYWNQGNENKAFQYYKQAADQGLEHQKLYLSLGRCYGRGWGTTANKSEAQKWLLKAYDAGAELDGDDLNFLTFCYYPDDRETAFPYAKAGAEAGDLSCMVILGQMYTYAQGTTANYSEAIYWFEKAIDMGVTGANEEYARSTIQEIVNAGIVDASEVWEYLPQ